MQIRHGIPAPGSGPVALTIGNFDGVHLGHQAILRRLVEEARRRDIAACVMTFEPHPREFFAPDQAPTRLTSLREKLELLEGFGVDVAQVCRFDFDFARITAEAFAEEMLARAMDARWVMVGDDFRYGARRAGDFPMLREAGQRLGFETAQMPEVAHRGLRVSSTAVREALAAGDLDLARELLGRPYSISGRVVDGDKIGKKLGFPTANIQLQHNRPPLWGIFVVNVDGLGPEPLPGVASLGVRPTVHERGQPQLEVHLFDFDRSIYRSHLRVNFLKKLREEEKYPDLQTLQRQIALDAEAARAYFRAANAAAAG